MTPPVDIHHISHELARLGEEIQRACDDRPDALDSDPRLLLDGLGDLLDTLSDFEADRPGASLQALRETTGSTPEALLTHGLGLLAKLVDQAQHLNLPGTARKLERLSLPLACWMLRRGTELDHPELVVRAGAGLAAELHEPEDLATLCMLMSEIVDGMSPARIQDSANAPRRPWRTLLLDRVNVAIRSGRPGLMAVAFEAIGEHLAEEAPDFFRETMGQLDSLGHAPQVRELIQRYYDLWCASQRLH